VVSKDPAVAGSMVFLGGGHPMNNSFTMISLKPRDQRKASADEVIRRLRKEITRVPGATLYLQSSQDVNVGGRTARTQYQYTLQDEDLNELSQWAPRMLAEMKKLPQLSDVASDQQTNSTQLKVDIDRDQASRFGIPISLIDQTLYDAYGQAQITQYFTQLNAYHVILEIPPKLQQDPNSLGELYVRSPLTGQMVPLSTLVKFDTHHATVLSINHQNQFPCVTLSFNLAPGASLGQAVDAIQKASDALRMPPTITATFQGTAQAFQASLASEPYLILAAIVVVYII